MTLADTLLEKLAELSPAAAVRRTLSFSDPATSTSVRVEVERLEAVGCELWEVGIACSAHPLQSVNLGAWAQRVADRVTGLLEPLKVVEFDNLRGQALLRSESPAQKDCDLHYYEVLLLKSGAAGLRRYHATKSPGPREQIPFAMTREALAKLVNDLTCFAG
jgi:hypothetical protein